MSENGGISGESRSTSPDDGIRGYMVFDQKKLANLGEMFVQSLLECFFRPIPYELLDYLSALED